MRHLAAAASAAAALGLVRAGRLSGQGRFDAAITAGNNQVRHK
ncbi:MAG TPA: hypothetical protein VGG11_00235 [Xanthobacteraceae bacterium]